MGDNALYKSNVSVTSLTASDLGTPGETRGGAGNGKLYQLVQATVSLSHGAAYQYQNATGATDGFLVSVNHLTDVRANGVWNGQTVSLVSNAYFWGQVRGVGPVLCGGTSAASNVAMHASSIGAVEAAASTVKHSLCFRTIQSVAVTVTKNMHIMCDLG